MKLEIHEIDAVGEIRRAHQTLPNRRLHDRVIEARNDLSAKSHLHQSVDIVRWPLGIGQWCLRFINVVAVDGDNRGVRSNDKHDGR